MKNSHIAELESYLEDAIAFKPDFRPLGYQENFPAYLNNNYSFYEGKIWDKTLLLAFLNDRTDKTTPAALKKQWENLKVLQPHLVLLALKEVPPYERNRLMRLGIPFVATNKQLFLPPLGIDIEEYWAATAKKKPQTQLGIVAQEILLGALYNPEGFATQRAHGLANRMELSKMHLTRALRELEHYECIRIEKRGRENHLVLADNRAVIWKRIFPALQSPVKERRYFIGNTDIKRQYGFRISGEQALAEKTLLMEPDHQVLAYYVKDWKALQLKLRLKEIPRAEPGCIEIELWRYQPTSDVINWSGDNYYVDPLSLIICFRDEEDERIQQAVEELKDEIPWLK